MSFCPERAGRAFALRGAEQPRLQAQKRLAARRSRASERFLKISERISRAPESGTVKLSQIARELKAAGREVFGLGEGEPDFDTPPHVLEAAHKAALQGHTRYTSVAGTPELRAAAAEKLRTENSLQCSPADLIVGTGAKQLIFNALLATLDPGDEVVIPSPYWVSYPGMVRIADGTPVVVACDAAAGFKLRPDAFAAAIGPRTRWVILNSPGNPSGAVYGIGELAALAEVVRRHPGVSVICDDIYEKIVFGQAKFATMAEAAPDLTNRILTVNGVSKSHAMTGWRIGYAAGPPDLIAAMVKLQGQSTTNASSVGQAAALAALTGPKDFLETWRIAYERRRDLVYRLLSEVAGLSLSQPEGAFYHFVNCEDLLGATAPGGTVLDDDGGFCRHLLDTAGIAVVPGSEFGTPGHFRLCFAKSDDLLERACLRIQDVVSQLS